MEQNNAAAVLINSSARSGKDSLTPNEIRHLLESHSLKMCQSLEISAKGISLPEVRSFILTTANNGIRYFISVGGDGTISLLVSEFIHLLESETLNPDEFFFGAIGTGSSNDFHKPKHGYEFKGCPVRLNFKSTVRQEMIRVRTRNSLFYGINNFSMGFTTEANERFNQPGIILRRIKQFSPDLAIVITALIQLIRLKSFAIRFRIHQDHQFETLRFNNLGLVKNPHIAGSFRYPDHESRKQKSLGFHVIHSCTRLQFSKILTQLIFGHFPSDQNRTSGSFKYTELKSDKPFSFEIDGEVYRDHHIRVDTFYQKLNFAT